MGNTKSIKNDILSRTWKDKANLFGDVQQYTNTLISGYVRNTLHSYPIPEIKQLCLNYYQSYFIYKVSILSSPILFEFIFKDSNNCADKGITGIILIPHNIKRSIDDILQIIFKGYLQCRVPVTRQFLKDYNKSLTQANSYIIVYNGYIYRYKIIGKINKNVYKVAKSHKCVIIHLRRNYTQKHQIAYYRIFVNNERVAGADTFFTTLTKYGVDITNINVGNNSKTNAWKIQESLELSSDFFENKTHEIAATNLSNALHDLQRINNDFNHGEMIGATIVVIPNHKTLNDCKLYLNQHFSISMEISTSSLLCIFSDNYLLNECAIIVCNNQIIAINVLFKNQIGNEDRHSSAKQFSIDAKSLNPIIFILSEKDGQISSCVDGKITNINFEYIPSLIIQHHSNIHSYHTLLKWHNIMSRKR